MRAATYEEQMELLQRQLFRLSAERAKVSADKSDSEPESDDEDAWDNGSEDEEAGGSAGKQAEGKAGDAAATDDGPRQKGSLVHFQNGCV